MKKLMMYACAIFLGIQINTYIIGAQNETVNDSSTNCGAMSFGSDTNPFMPFWLSSRTKAVFDAGMAGGFRTSHMYNTNEGCSCPNHPDYGATQKITDGYKFSCIYPSNMRYDASWYKYAQPQTDDGRFLTPMTSNYTKVEKPFDLARCNSGYGVGGFDACQRITRDEACMWAYGVYWFSCGALCSDACNGKIIDRSKYKDGPGISRFANVSYKIP